MSGEKTRELDTHAKLFKEMSEKQNYMLIRLSQNLLKLEYHAGF